MFVITNPVIDPKIGDTANTPAGQGASYIFQLFLINFIRLGFVIGVVVFLFMLIMGSIEYITAGGEKEKAAAASKRLTNAVIGIGIMFSIFAITTLIKTVFGIDILQFQIPKI